MTSSLDNRTCQAAWPSKMLSPIKNMYMPNRNIITGICQTKQTPRRRTHCGAGPLTTDAGTGPFEVGSGRDRWLLLARRCSTPSDVAVTLHPRSPLMYRVLSGWLLKRCSMTLCCVAVAMLPMMNIKPLYQQAGTSHVVLAAEGQVKALLMRLAMIAPYPQQTKQELVLTARSRGG